MARKGCSLADLARKYGELLGLRHGRVAFDVVALRRLSSEFPGALRELDALPLAELELRLGKVERAGQETWALEPWIEWMLAYHDTMRLALDVRARLLGQRQPSPTQVEATLGALGGRCDAAFVHAVMNPPRGRLNVLVFAQLGARFGRAPHEIEGRLFRAEAA